MSAIDVLARALHEQHQGRTKYCPWEALAEGAKGLWRDQAEVIAGRMIEAEPAPDPERNAVRWLAEGEPMNLEGSINTLLGYADYLNEIAGTRDQYPPTRLIQLLASLRDTTRTLQAVDALLVRDIYLRGEHGDYDVDGVGRVSVKRARERRQWEAREAVFAYVDARMSGFPGAENGEWPPPAEVADWVMEVLPATASTSCKVTALKNVGLDPAVFCEDLPGNLQVELPRRS